MLHLLTDADRLADYAEKADRALLAEEGDPEDIEVQRARLARLQDKPEFYVDQPAEKQLTRAGIDRRIEWLDAQTDALEAAIAADG